MGHSTKVGTVEVRGVDYIPEVERHVSPRHLFYWVTADPGRR